ncbi:MAG TPA: ABC transporter permease [Acidimicrobiales bacterium]|nr:ABC transporter permease [Acidimicrobiales bacterium]
MTDTLREPAVGPGGESGAGAAAEGSPGTGVAESPADQEGAARRPANRRARTMVARVVPALVTLLLFLGVWEFASTQLMSPHRRFLLPTPGSVLRHGLLDGTTMHQITSSLWLTTRLALFGLAVAIALGVVLGILMFRVRWAERAAYPYLVALQAVPVLAIAPLMTVLFGYSFWAKSIIVVIIAFFPIPTTLLLGMKSVDKGLIDLFRLSGASWSTQLRKLAFPSALPSLFTGLRISAGLSVIGAIVGELFFQQGDPGLGQRIYAYQTNMQYPQLYTAIIFSSLLGIAIFTVFGWIGHRALRSWHESAGEER